MRSDWKKKNRTTAICRYCGKCVSPITSWPIKTRCTCRRGTPGRPKLSFWDQAVGFAKSMKDFVAEGMPWCVKQHWLDRMDVCSGKSTGKKCEHLVNNRCQLCGCRFHTKSKSPSWHCPDTPDRWADVDSNYAHLYTTAIESSMSAIITAFLRPESLRRLMASLQLHHPSLATHVEDTKGNLSAGRNAAVKAVDAKYLLLLEDDFECRDGPIDLQAMRNVLEHDKSVGVVAGVLREPQGIRETASDLFKHRDTLERIIPPSRPWKFTDRGTSYRYCDMACNFFLARREVLLKNPWDEELELHEHAPWFWELKNEQQWRVAYCPAATIFHHRDRGNPEYNRLRQRGDQFTPIIKKRYGFTHVQQLQSRTGMSGIVVMGVGHSNTTITARQLLALGFHGGAVDENYCENVKVRTINHAKSFDHQAQREAIDELRLPWMVKDPRFVFTLHHWHATFANYQPLLLWVQKDMHAVYASFQRRGASIPLDAVVKKFKSARKQFDDWPFAKMMIDAGGIANACGLFSQDVWQESMAIADGSPLKEDMDAETKTTGHAIHAE